MLSHDSSVHQFDLRYLAGVVGVYDESHPHPAYIIRRLNSSMIKDSFTTLGINHGCVYEGVFDQ